MYFHRGSGGRDDERRMEEAARRLVGRRRCFRRLALRLWVVVAWAVLRRHCFHRRFLHVVWRVHGVLGAFYLLSFELWCMKDGTFSLEL